MFVSYFNAFFKEKITNIRSAMSNSDVISNSDTGRIICTFAGTPLMSLHPFSPVSILEIVKSSNKTTCELDPIPTKILMEHMDVLLPVVTDIINLSLSSGIFPDCLKHAVVKL